MKPFLVCGGYATAPVQGSRDDEISFYTSLLSSSPKCGLEIPLFNSGKIHKSGDEDIILNALIKAGCPSSILTLVPGTMQSISQNKHFGLASDDTQGRLDAIEFVRKAKDAINRINNALGKKSIIAIEILSAPSRFAEGVSSSVASLTSSLIELSTWNLFDAEILIEHCDQGGLLKDVKPQKGFLSFDEELEAINTANKIITDGNKIGVCINWARAVLEIRDVSRPLQLIQSAKDLLRCLIFSGCSEKPSHEGYGSFLDSHMPWYDNAEGSLLTSEEICKSILAAKTFGKLIVCGVKVTLQPPESTPEQRANVNRSMIDSIVANLEL